MNNTDVDLFERIRGQIKQLYAEISLLSKSKPDGAINKFKLKFINEKLAEAHGFLGDEFRPSRDFATFDEVDMPTNSDVTMILSQYLDGLEAWRCAHIFKDSIYWYWDVDGEQLIRTDSPSRYRKGQGGEDEDE